jgi:hypothetical protein
MTQVPPARIPGAATHPPPDPEMDAWLDAWLAAHTGHRRRVRQENARFAAEITALREKLSSLSHRRLPPCETAGDETRWHQAALEELEV